MAAPTTRTGVVTEFVLWALWQAAAAVRVTLRPLAPPLRAVARATARARAAVDRVLLRIDLAVSELFVDPIGRLQARTPYVLFGALIVGNLTGLAL